MSNRRVLIIDDDPEICNLVAMVLRLENYQTAIQTDVTAEELIALLEQEKPHLLILDYHLHSKTTIDYLPHIRADENWQALCVLMTSGIDFRSECLAAGADEFLLKPFDMTKLTSTLKNLPI